MSQEFVKEMIIKPQQGKEKKSEIIGTLLITTWLALIALYVII